MAPLVGCLSAGCTFLSTVPTQPTFHKMGYRKEQDAATRRSLEFFLVCNKSLVVICFRFSGHILHQIVRIDWVDFWSLWHLRNGLQCHHSLPAGLAAYMDIFGLCS